MTDKSKPEVVIELGGVKRTLVFNWWAISLLEEEKGPEFLDPKNLASLTPAKLIVLTWAALCSNCEELDGTTPAERRAGQRKVAQWINANNMGKVSTAIIEAINASIASAKEGEQLPVEKKSGNEPTS
jgi:hypothetical protein